MHKRIVVDGKPSLFQIDDAVYRVYRLVKPALCSECGHPITKQSTWVVLGDTVLGVQFYAHGAYVETTEGDNLRFEDCFPTMEEAQKEADRLNKEAADE